MELNNTSQYAIRILGYIASNGEDGLLSAKELSEVLNIPYKFLTKIMTDLTKADFILSIRGREGGYKLARPSNEISIMEILNQFNELTNYAECILGIGKCDSKKRCALHEQWVKPKTMMLKMFKETTLDKLKGPDYKI
ncbi:Rrf2 family transcriptional regulator [Sulfurimonas sp. SAG-AH-194-I05]|nr:Rrf2 family transcriptional regulator [Sulfurimonas sp. SAG-AH-194-I05]MDF1875647.1 Rrf2 family transcriptional regulator [Sulfurimonas sp. SAG-AH-194-I05]